MLSWYGLLEGQEAKQILSSLNFFVLGQTLIHYLVVVSTNKVGLQDYTHFEVVVSVNFVVGQVFWHVLRVMSLNLGEVHWDSRIHTCESKSE